MQEFPINCSIPNVSTTDERRRKLLKLRLSDEWAIVLVSNPPLRVVLLPAFLMINSIEIHRKNTAGKCSVLGELRIMQHGAQVFQKKFSQSIETGTSFAETCSNMTLNYSPQLWFEGFVKISDTGKKQQASLANEESKLKIELKSLEELSNDFERLLHPESSCPADITLKCNGVSIPAHKTILSARSPVFAAMFAHSMNESLKNEMCITDIDESVLRALLKYMYTGKISNLTVDSAAELLFAADKCQLQDLKEVCSFYLKDAISPQNVWKILGLGDMYSADLKTFAVDYICNNYEEFSVVEKTKEWNELRKEKPNMAMELLESLVKYRNEKIKH
ncbi:unnamed protein product [Larinioides sclopetarius]|uniref:BTB domain-containing protein n=1 Tax=Larinioides sclopetarius TaxID=280406 RepID=A0AAV2ARL6_9ARAC